MAGNNGGSEGKIKRIETTRLSDDVVFTKEIVEVGDVLAKKKALETKDILDLVIKVIGLVSILLAILNYTDAKRDKELAAIKDTQKQMEINQKELVKNYRDSMQQLKDNNLNDSNLKIRLIQLEYDKLRDQREYDQKNQLFQQQWINTIKQMKSQQLNERKGQEAKNLLELYDQVSACITG